MYPGINWRIMNGKIKYVLISLSVLLLVSVLQSPASAADLLSQETTTSAASAPPVHKADSNVGRDWLKRRSIHHSPSYTKRFVVKHGMRFKRGKTVITHNPKLDGRIASIRKSKARLDCGHYPLGTIVTAKIYKYRPKYYSSGYGVGRWQPAIRYELKRQGVYSKFMEDKLLHIMEGESTGNPNNRFGQHRGLFQFNNAWGSEAERLDPRWSIKRIVKVYRVGGLSKIQQHWKATYY